MMHSVKKDNLEFNKGDTIIGRWQQTRYTVMRQLGKGMIGTVYLCRAKGRLVALKISEQQMQMTTEVNVMKELNEVQDSRLGPFLHEVDDWISLSGQVYSFYAMEYIAGEAIHSYVRDKGEEWLVVLLIQLLDELDKVHQAGYVFGDLKKEHIIIEKHPVTVRCIDVGGMTKRGRSVKEYSEFYDRAYWQLGTRKAEPSYDLFALVMIVLSIYYPNPFKRRSLPLPFLSQKVTNIKRLHLIHPILLNALSGKYDAAQAMKDALIKTVVKKRTKRSQPQKSATSYLIQSVFVASVASLYYILSLFL